MPGAIEAIAAFLGILNDSGVAKQYKAAYDKRTAEDLLLKKNVDAMKDAPPPNKGAPNA